MRVTDSNANRFFMLIPEASNLVLQTLFLSKGGDVFTFVDMNTKAIELESGVSVNEPVTYAIRTAIEFAVLEIIHAGEQKKYWKFKKEEIGIHSNVQTN